jgi:hypothetical protein
MAPTAVESNSKAAPHPDSSTKKAAPQAEAGSFNFPTPPTYATLEEERQGRKERLALSFRIFGQLGFDEGVAGHLTLRDPIHTDSFWVNPFGKNFKNMTVSDLLLIGPDGKIRMGGKPDGQYLNSAAFAIHHAIHSEYSYEKQIVGT